MNMEYDGFLILKRRAKDESKMSIAMAEIKSDRRCKLRQ